MYGRLDEAIESFLDWGRVTTSSISSRVKNLLGTVDCGDGEIAKEQVLGTHAAILARPVAPTNAGHFEVMFVRLGEERRPIASHEPRWQVDVEEGEVVVRAFGENASRIRLKPNGDVVIEAGGNILLGSGTAAEALALATKVHEELDKIRNAITTAAVGGAPDAGATFKTNIIANLTSPTGIRGEVGSERVKADD
ncbi:MAG: hypothetical protein MUE69_30305 [Myxococcota bacterium]|jgi:hypothetical protein|nr:hypothetical protein [Myxococcota bacterium]